MSITSSASAGRGDYATNQRDIGNGHSQSRQRALVGSIAALAFVVFGSTVAIADLCKRPVDHEYETISVDSLLLSPIAACDANGATTDSWSILRVATASGRSLEQEFLGELTNRASGSLEIASADSHTPWDVVPVGRYLSQWHTLNTSFATGAWPTSVPPTLCQMQTVAACAETSGLCDLSDFATLDFDGARPLGICPGIPADAEWNWRSGSPGPWTFSDPAPFGAGNHDLSLVFRAVSAAGPELATLVLSP